MVSTRSHPTPLPAPSASSPSKTPSSPSPSNARSTRARNNNNSSRSKGKNTWTHTPTPLTLSWLLISLPLVIWDTGYVLLRPHTFPGGRFHRPFYVPYALYGVVDKIYGVEAWEASDGFAAAQGLMNAIETVGYLIYLGVVWRFGVGEAEESEDGGEEGVVTIVRRRLGFEAVLGGEWGGIACLVGFAMSVMTVSKTLLYWLYVAFSGFQHIGHNDIVSLILYWIIPNGLWIVLPSYMTYVFVSDIAAGLAIAGADSEGTLARAAIMAKEE